MREILKTEVSEVVSSKGTEKCSRREALKRIAAASAGAVGIALVTGCAELSDIFKSDSGTYSSYGAGYSSYSSPSRYSSYSGSYYSYYSSYRAYYSQSPIYNSFRNIYYSYYSSMSYYRR